MKITIIGYSGAGKSTLARSLSQHYAIPCLHLDQLRFRPNWEETPDEVMQARLADFLVSESSWIIEGNYSSFCYKERLEQADQIIFMNFSRWNCLYRAFKRYLRYRGEVRESMAAGCPEKFDWAFICWILMEGRTRDIRNRYKTVCETYSSKVVILHHQKELDDYLSSLLKSQHQSS